MRGRKPKLDRPAERKAHIPGSLDRRVRFLLTDEATGKVPHGAFSALVARLLRHWVRDEMARQGLTDADIPAPSPPRDLKEYLD